MREIKSVRHLKELVEHGEIGCVEAWHWLQSDVNWTEVHDQVYEMIFWDERDARVSRDT